MATTPTATDIRNFLEGNSIDSTLVSDTWIETRRDRFIIPYIEKICRTSLTGIDTVTDYYSGNGENYLVLHQKNVIALTNIEFVVGGGTWVFNLSNVELITDEGIIKAKRNFQETWIKPYFPKGNKNIKVTYTVGYAGSSIPDDLSEAIIFLTAEKILGLIASRCGGGDISIQAFSKSYGSRGKFTDFRNELARMGMAICRTYMTYVAGES